jgi:fucose 4-O-acetylase-like acetyltransferase
MNSNRWLWADVAKGLAILLVIINHTGEGIYNAGIARRTTSWMHFHDICYTFMVPVFFVLSGSFSQMSQKHTMRIRVRQLASGLIYPYALWSIIQATLTIVTQAGNTRPEWSDLPGILLNGWMQFWFLHCLVLITIWDILSRYFEVTILARLCASFALAVLMIIGIALPWQLGAVANHLVYYEVGVFLASKMAFNVMMDRKHSFFLGSTALLAAFYCADASYGNRFQILGALAGIVMIGASSMIIATRQGRISKSLGFLGEYSLQIYVLHVIFAAGTRVFLLKMGIDSFSIQLWSGNLVGIGGSLAVAIIDKRYLGSLFRLPVIKMVKTGSQRMESNG